MTIKIGAVILAAGAGTRLGGAAKALLVGPSGKTFLDDIVATARAVGLDAGVIVVGPPFGDGVAARAEELGLVVVENRRPERGMASSVALGFAAIAETACEAAWLWPVDHPGVTTATLRALVDALDPAAEVARPVVQGRRGHPPLIARGLWPRLVGCADLDGGARTVLAGARVRDVPIDDAGCIRDVDTALDLEALR